MNSTPCSKSAWHNPIHQPQITPNNKQAARRTSNRLGVRPAGFRLRYDTSNHVPTWARGTLATRQLQVTFNANTAILTCRTSQITRAKQRSGDGREKRLAPMAARLQAGSVRWHWHATTSCNASSGSASLVTLTLTLIVSFMTYTINTRNSEKGAASCASAMCPSGPALCCSTT